jgi:hypothetical protein
MDKDGRAMDGEETCVLVTEAGGDGSRGRCERIADVLTTLRVEETTRWG